MHVINLGEKSNRKKKDKQVTTSDQDRNAI